MPSRLLRIVAFVEIAMAIEGPRGAYIDLTGQRFGRWAVISHIGRGSAKQRGHLWLCKCECGTERDVRSSDLRNGKSHSCGCIGAERARTLRPNLKHGFARTATYYVWCGMRERCNSLTNKDYPNYGGRGIRVCERWDDYTNFLADMGERPAGMTIDRIDTNGNYEPGNCRWATLFTQANNKRNNVFVEHNGIRQTVSQWAHQAGRDPELVRGRLRVGWSLPRALQEPPQRRS